MMKKICVNGLGYISLPTASTLSTKGYDIIVILVNHKEFYNIDREKLKGKILIDTKGVLK